MLCMAGAPFGVMHSVGLLRLEDRRFNSVFGLHSFQNNSAQELLMSPFLEEERKRPLQFNYGKYTPARAETALDAADGNRYNSDVVILHINFF